MAAELVATPVQILVNVAETLSASFYNDDGTIVDPGTVTVGITDAAGNTIVAALTATSGSGAAARTYALAAQTELDILTVTWTSGTYGAFTQRVEVVGALLFTVREARLFDSAALTSTTTYTAAAIDEARARILDELEAICGVSFVPRYRREVVAGSGLASLRLPVREVRSVRSVETRESGGTVWTAYTVTELADVLIDPLGALTRETLGVFTSGTGNIRLAYEHGYDAPSLNIKRVALMVLVYQLVQSNWSDRTTSISTEVGTANLWTANLSGRGEAVYSLPEVDRVLRLYSELGPVIA